LKLLNKMSFVMNKNQWDHVVKRLRESIAPINNEHVISFDTETVDYGWKNLKPVGFSVGWFDSTGNPQGTYVPLLHKSDGIVDPNMPFGQVYPDLKEILEDPEICVVMHNAKYDINVARLFNSPIEIDHNIHDTMLGEWLLNTSGVGTADQRRADKGSHSLSKLVDYYFNYEMTELRALCPSDRGVLLVDEASVHDMGKYATDDAVYPLRLYENQIRRFNDEPRLKRILYGLEIEMEYVLADMELDGIEVEVEYLARMGKKIKEEIAQINKQIFEARPGQDFEPIDPETIVKAVEGYADLERRYKFPKDHEEYPINPNTGGPAGKGWMRNKMFEELGLEDHPLQDKIREAFSVTTNLENFLRRWPELAHKAFNTTSTLALNKILFEEANLTPYGDKGKSGLWSTKASFIEKWADEHPVAENLNRLRELTKLEGTYIDGMLERVDDDGRIRTRYNQIITTGRLSSRDPNLQNVVHNEDYPIRKVFVGTDVAASTVEIHEEDDQGYPSSYEVKNNSGGFAIYEGRVARWWGNNPPWPLMVADYSQLEIRILAHMSQDPVLLPALRAGQDVHSLTAQNVFDEVPDNISLDEVTADYKEWRTKAKPINFGIIYGMGPNKLAKALGITSDDAKDIINRYLSRYPGVQKYIQDRHNHADKYGFVETLIGRKRHLPLATWANNGLDTNRRLTKDEFKEYKKGLWRAHRIAQNSPIQGTAADIIAIAMINLREFYLGISPIDLDFNVFTSPDDGGKKREFPWRKKMWRNSMRMLVQVHDELVMEFHPAIANWGMDKTNEIMSNAVDLDVPLLVDSALGANWYHTKD